MNRQDRRAHSKQLRTHQRAARRDPGASAAQALAKRVSDLQADLNRYATMHKIAGDALQLAGEYPELPLPDDYEPGVDGNPNAVRERAAEQATIMRDTSRELVFETLVELFNAYDAFDDEPPAIEVVPPLVGLGEIA